MAIYWPGQGQGEHAGGQAQAQVRAAQCQTLNPHLWHTQPYPRPSHGHILDPAWRHARPHPRACLTPRASGLLPVLQAPPTEASSNAGWWREHLGRDLSGPNAPQAPPLRSHPVSDPSPGGRTDAELQRATAAWNLGGTRSLRGSSCVKHVFLFA